MNDLRNSLNIDLGKLKPTEHLKTMLPMSCEVYVQPKLDGQRYTLQLGPSGTFMVSRSRHGKTKGVDHSSKEEFVVIPCPLGDFDFDSDIILDGELVVCGSTSASSEVTRTDTPKKFVVFDLLWFDGNIRDLPYTVRFDLAAKVVKHLNEATIEMVPSYSLLSFDEQSLEGLFEIIKESGMEGFVVKPTGRAYDKNNYGWKVKLVDTCDAFVVGFNEEKKHTLGKVTKTGRVGSVAVAWNSPFAIPGVSTIVAWVSLPEADRCLMAEAPDKLVNRVLAFKHLGWDGKLFRFPQFDRWRDGEKNISDCVWDESKTKVMIKSEVED